MLRSLRRPILLLTDWNMAASSDVSFRGIHSSRTLTTFAGCFIVDLKPQQQCRHHLHAQVRFTQRCHTAIHRRMHAQQVAASDCTALLPRKIETMAHDHANDADRLFTCAKNLLIMQSLG